MPYATEYQPLAVTFLSGTNCDFSIRQRHAGRSMAWAGDGSAPQAFAGSPDHRSTGYGERISNEFLADFEGRKAASEEANESVEQ